MLNHLIDPDPKSDDAATCGYIEAKLAACDIVQRVEIERDGDNWVASLQLPFDGSADGLRGVLGDLLSYAELHIHD